MVHNSDATNITITTEDCFKRRWLEGEVVGSVTAYPKTYYYQVTGYLYDECYCGPKKDNPCIGQDLGDVVGQGYNNNGIVTYLFCVGLKNGCGETQPWIEDDTPPCRLKCEETMGISYGERDVVDVELVPYKNCQCSKSIPFNMEWYSRKQLNCQIGDENYIGSALEFQLIFNPHAEATIEQAKICDCSEFEPA